MIRNKLTVFREYLRLSTISELSRRYFVMNSFDGALTMLGIILGSYVYDGVDVSLILGAGFGATFAMAISGLTGAYMTERAERRRDLFELERAMQRNMKNSMYAKAMKAATMWVMIVDGGAPLLSGTVALTPFLCATMNIIDALSALYLAIGLVMVMLFVLGLFLGKISKENLILSGVKTLAIGIGTAVILIILGNRIG